MAKLTSTEKGALSVIAGVIVCIAAFWIVVGYTAMHFIVKFW